MSAAPAPPVPPASPIANFAAVDQRLWRGARPSREQALWLAAQGVATALDLEWEGADDALFTGTGVACVRDEDFELLPLIDPGEANEHVLFALAAIRDAAPIVYVHCRDGQNRTGVVCAAYRLLILGQPLDAVLADFSSFKPFWGWADQGYIRSLAARHDELLGRLTTTAGAAGDGR